MNRSTLAMIAALALAAPAFAMAADSTTTTMRPKLAGLDLNTPEGAKTAFDRISEAADSACSAPITGSRLPTVDASCKRDMVAQAVRQLHAPKVSALLNAPTSKSERRDG
jgi:UrcA family protein